MDITPPPQGFTLVEGLTVMAILSVVTSLAISNWGQMMANKHIRTSMESLYNTLKLARSESIKRHATITVSFRNYKDTSSPSWCYALSDGGNCDCRIFNACTIDGVSVIQTDVNTPSTLATNNLTGSTDAKFVSFEHIRGTTSNSGSIQFTSGAATGLVNISAMGFINSCSSTVPGYPSC